MEPPTSLAREWGNGLKRRGGGSRCAGSGRCGEAVGRKNCRMGWLTRRRGRCPRAPARGTPPWNRQARWRVVWQPP